MSICKNCNNNFDQKFCGFCGQSAIMNEKINLKDFCLDIFHTIFHTGSGFFFTIKNLFFKPDVVVKGYLEGKRKIYFSPVKLFLITGTVYVFVNHFVNKNKIDLNTQTLDYYFDHYKYLMIFGPILLSTILNFLIYYRKKWLIAEHFITSLFTFSIIYILSSFFMVLNNLFQFKLAFYGIIISVIFYSYAMTNIYFTKNRIIGFILNIFIYIIIQSLFILPFLFLIKR